MTGGFQPTPEPQARPLQPVPPVAPSTQSEPVVVFEDVSIGFGREPLLEGLSFAVRQGETRILLGPAGVGKSVLLKLVNGLIRPDSGRIFVFGNEISAMREDDLFEIRGSIGTVFQEGALFDSLTVHDNVGYRLMEEHLPDDEITRRVTEALRFVELEHTLTKFPSELSGGMRRRVAIARAIVTNPKLILYDSPTAGLDPITSTTIIELVMKQRDVSHTTSLVVTHRLQDAFVLATHRFSRSKNTMEPLPPRQIDPHTSFLMLYQGRLIFDGTTAELVHSDDPLIRSYLS
ncbi:MAG TPA: ATP-binding cassette domain-containing protein [Acidobacteriaceae bacterium]|nr:ATP-binding cassette domain-containing protein [Acidobacteriaceae bacterium]